MIKVIISGICGKMGREIALLALNDPDFEIAGGVEAPASAFLGKDIGEILGVKPLGFALEKDLNKIVKNGNCVIEFTEPSATCEHVEIAKANRVAMVIGTTSLDERQVEIVKNASRKVPIVFSPNMSIGVNVLFKLAAESARVLGKEYGVNIEEAHHVHKKDAPSGTAKKLAEIIKSNKKDPIEHVDIKSIREGEIIGDHRVRFEGKYETLQLSHSAKSRDAFAQGALAAAKFVVSKKHGLYTMADALGLKE